jgi:hypothetical protein
VLEIDVGDFSEFAAIKRFDADLDLQTQHLELERIFASACSVRKGMPCFILESCRQITTAANLANITE